MNYYEELGIDKNATTKEIKDLYRKLAKVYHPDLGGNLEKMKRIVIAYETLCNTDLRNEYDNNLSTKGAQQARTDYSNYEYTQESDSENESHSESQTATNCSFQREEPIYSFDFFGGDRKWTTESEILWNAFCEWSKSGSHIEVIDFSKDPVSSYYNFFQGNNSSLSNQISKNFFLRKMSLD